MITFEIPVVGISCTGQRDLGARSGLLADGRGPGIVVGRECFGEFKKEVDGMGWDIRINVRNEYLPAYSWAITDPEIRLKKQVE